MKDKKFKLTTFACLMGLLVSTQTMAETEVQKLRKEVDALNEKVSEWENKEPPKTLIHLAGYADVGYTDSQSAVGSFNVGTFSPIFHYQFANRFMLEAELEFEIGEDGESEVGVDYLTVDWFINDYAILVAGKFLSPLGQFRQNLHPSWINRLASAPTGFGHDQAAPNADVGLLMRGGYLLKSRTSFNYTAYIANGPTLEANGSEIEKIESPGLNTDGDGEKVIGARFGMYFPNQSFEYGVSAATGRIAVRSGSSSAGYSYDADRQYDVLGADLTWRNGNLDVRAEYIQQRIGSQASSVAPSSGKWAAWYAQAAYRFLPANWEVVARIGQYDTPADSTDVDQITLGVNYLFATNLVAKLNYEINDNPNAGFATDNRALAQLAYGF